MERTDSPWEALASCIEYPTAGLLAQVERTISLVKKQDREAWRLIDRFRAYLASVPVESAEEIHAETFDLEPGCCLYVGYHLFGDTHRRSLFMARLVEWYQACDFSVAGELPDHLGVLLRFLPRAGKGAEKSELVEYCLMPALDAICRGLNTKKSPYGDLIAAVRALVGREKGDPG